MVVLVDGDERRGRVMVAGELHVAVAPCLGENGPGYDIALEAEVGGERRARGIEGLVGTGSEVICDSRAPVDDGTEDLVREYVSVREGSVAL